MADYEAPGSCSPIETLCKQIQADWKAFVGTLEDSKLRSNLIKKKPLKP